MTDALSIVERAARDLAEQRAEPAPVGYEAWVRQMATCIGQRLDEALRETFEDGRAFEAEARGGSST